MRTATKEWTVARVEGRVVLTMNEETAAAVASILERVEERILDGTNNPVTWTDLVGDLRTAS